MWLSEVSSVDELQTDNDLEILYQDEYLLAVNKPAGIIVHADGTNEPSLTDVVCEKLRALEGSSQMDISQIQALNRLDKETTGIVLFSLKKETQPQFDQLIASKELSKEYLAVVKRAFEPNKLLIDKAIGKDRHDAQKMRVSATGKPSQTEVRLIKVASSAQGQTQSLLLVNLLTGRRHQIRVHLSSLRFPLVGDALYGGVSSLQRGAKKKHKAQPLMLHAYRVGFIHPVTGAKIVIKTDIPERFSYFGVTEVD
ncbi:MAG: RluA family pseudouridine synthase [Atopobium sp.]|nr:RluA family pseudouridine synthase [Atopobium sp.]